MEAKFLKKEEQTLSGTSKYRRLLESFYVSTITRPNLGTADEVTYKKTDSSWHYEQDIQEQGLQYYPVEQFIAIKLPTKPQPQDSC